MNQESEKARREKIKGIGGNTGLKQEEREGARSHFLSNKREKLKMELIEKRVRDVRTVRISSLFSLLRVQLIIVIRKRGVVRKRTSGKNCAGGGASLGTGNSTKETSVREVCQA